MASSILFDARKGETQINPDLHTVADRIHLEFDKSLDPQAVDECLNRVGATFDNAKVRSFVPLLVRRYVRDELNEQLTKQLKEQLKQA